MKVVTEKEFFNHLKVYQLREFCKKMAADIYNEVLQDPSDIVDFTHFMELEGDVGGKPICLSVDAVYIFIKNQPGFKDINDVFLSRFIKKIKIYDHRQEMSFYMALIEKEHFCRENAVLLN